jgi:hypothetical protein
VVVWLARVLEKLEVLVNPLVYLYFEIHQSKHRNENPTALCGENGKPVHHTNENIIPILF